LPDRQKGDRLPRDAAGNRRTRHPAYVEKLREDAMPKYLIEGHYTAEGTKGLVHEGGVGRRSAVAKMADAVGGRLDSFYFAFGGVDVFAVIDVPDNVTAAAVGLAVNQAGSVAIKTTVLITPEEIDQAAKKAVSYRPPGR
jgi:uncharacterized protein with GYD domain